MILKFVILYFKDTMNSPLTGNTDNFNNVGINSVSGWWHHIYWGCIADVSIFKSKWL